MGTKMISPYKLWVEAKGNSDEYRRLLLKHGCIKLRRKPMHYRNGREAKNGDKIVELGISDGKIVAYGVLHSAVPGNDYCNGYIAAIQGSEYSACMIDCLHLDDVEAILTEKGLNKRPDGK